MTVTTPTPLTGTSGGAPVNANLNITSTALQPGSYASGSGTMTVNHVGVHAGPAGGPWTGVSTVHAVKTVGATTVDAGLCGLQHRDAGVRQHPVPP